MEYIRDSRGKILATQTRMGNKTVTRDFASNRVTATFNPNTNRTLDFSRNEQSRGDQSLRFVKK
jgi:hypothetical protein